MHISALFVTCKPKVQTHVIAQVSQLPWAETHLEESSKLIITIEASDEGEAEQKVRHLESIKGVLFAQVTGFYSSES